MRAGDSEPPAGDLQPYVQAGEAQAGAGLRPQSSRGAQSSEPEQRTRKVLIPPEVERLKGTVEAKPEHSAEARRGAAPLHRRAQARASRRALGARRPGAPHLDRADVEVGQGSARAALGGGDRGAEDDAAVAGLPVRGPEPEDPKAPHVDLQRVGHGAARGRAA
jgi:hypothetical protein